MKVWRVKKAGGGWSAAHVFDDEMQTPHGFLPGSNVAVKAGLEPACGLCKQVEPALFVEKVKPLVSPLAAKRRK